MTMQILRYGALALVSMCLVMIALVIGGIVPLETVRGVMARVPEMVRVAPADPVKVAKTDVTAPSGESGSTDQSQTKADGAAADGATPQADAGVEAAGQKADDRDGEAETSSAQETDTAKASQNDPSDPPGQTTETQAGDADGQIIPAFDVLRVEKDGSIVVAGRAKPNSTVELRTSDGNIVGGGKAGARGDFVIIPDSPLRAGNYSMILVMTDEDGNESVSTEIATVSVPEGQDGEVLALLSREGEASRIIAKPSTLETDDQPDSTQDTDAADGNTSGGESDAAKTELEKIERSTEDTASANAERSPGTGTGNNDDQNDSIVETDGTGSGVENGSTVSVRVEAVEIERDQLFVAGEAPSGSIVRIYIDDELVGEARGTSDNRFLITKQYDLQPGEHRVRADSIDRSTGKVLARAEVPLLHDPVETVAQSNGSDGNAQEATQDAQVDPNTEADGDNEGSPVASNSDAEATQDGSDTKVTEAQTDQASSNNEVAIASTDDATGNQSTSKRVADNGNAADKPDTAGKAETSSATANADQAEVDGATTDESITTTPEPKASDNAASEPQQSEVSATASEPVEIETISGESATSIASSASTPPGDTIRTGSSVIIKPGDNLWRISRKTYGRGIRYTTIYEANRDQIRNPNRIYIGQIFKIPDRPDEELVEADG